MSSMSSPNRSPLSKRKSPRPEEGLYGNLLEPDMKKMRLNSTASADDGGAEVQAAGEHKQLHASDKAHTTVSVKPVLNGHARATS